MRSVIVAAAREFLKEERARKVRPKFTKEARTSLASQLGILGAGERNDIDIHAFRGAVAVDVVGYQSSFEDSAVNVIADILHALEKAGHDPLLELAHARAEFFRDKGLGESGDPSENAEPDVWPTPGEELEGGIEAVDESGETDR